MNNLSSKIKIFNRRLIKDKRGWFLKVIEGKEEKLPAFTGEVYFTCAYPGHIKGCHYHVLANEWFSPVTGKAILKLEDINTGEKLEIPLDAENPVTVFVPSLVAHAIFNMENKDFIMGAYTDQFYKPEDTIFFNFNVE